MRVKISYIVIVVLLMCGGGYWVVNALYSSKQAAEENKNLVLQNEKMTKENNQLSKTVARLELLKTKVDTESFQKEKEDAVIPEEISINEKLNEVNAEFVSVAFNFEDLKDRSSNMKAYMTEELKTKYMKENESSGTSELENVQVSGELEEYQMYINNGKDGKINVINDVSLTYSSGSEKTDHRMMFLVSYDEKSLKVLDVQFSPVMNTNQE